MILSPDALLAKATRFEFGGDMMECADFTVQYRGDDRWAVCMRTQVLNVDGEFEYEPLPSSRDDEFRARCRFQRDVAIDIATIADAKLGGRPLCNLTREQAAFVDQCFADAVKIATDRRTVCICPAHCDCARPDPMVGGVALVSNACPVHNDNPWPVDGCPAEVHAGGQTWPHQ